MTTFKQKTNLKEDDIITFKSKIDLKKDYPNCNLDLDSIIKAPILQNDKVVGLITDYNLEKDEIVGIIYTEGCVPLND